VKGRREHVPWRKESERMREGDREQHVGSHRKNTSPKPLTGESRGMDFRKFLQAREFKV